MSMSTHYPNFSGTSGLGSVFKSFAKSLKSSSSSHTTSPILVNPKVVGGGADQHVLFNQLSGGSTLQVRASAAVKMSDSLNKYAISSIPEIWYSARDLCEVKNNPQIRRTAVQLLLRCIEQDNSLSTSVRLVYFGDIARYCQNTEHKLDPDFDIFLQALKQLTNDGRDIYDLTVYNPELNLVSFIDKNLNLLGEIYQRSSGNGASNGVPLSPLATATTVTTIQSLTSSVLSSQQQHGDGESTLTLSRKALLGLIQFTRNCLKFNFNAIEENPLATVMINIFTVGVMSCLKEQQQIQSQQLFRTSTQIQQQLQQILALNPTLMQKQKLVLATSLDVAEIELIRLCTELVHSVVLFGHIPTQCFSQAIEFLCCSYPICTEIVWETVTNLSESGSYLVLSGLTDILQNDELQRMKEPISRPVQSCIGAIELLERIHIVKSNENRSSIEYIFFTLFKATQTNFLYNVPILVTCYLKSLNRLFLEEHSRKFERLFPFLVWNATTLSAFEILKSVVLNSKEDEELWRGICDKLQVLYEKHHVLHTPRDKLVDFFMYQHQLLNEDNIQFVFNFYSEERLCVCHANPQWRQNSFKLLSYFYYNDTTSSKIKINTLKLLQNSFNLLIDIMDLEIVIDILRRSQSMNDTTVLVFLKIFLIKQVLLKFLMQNYSEIISIFKKGITDQSEEFTSVLTEAFCEIFVVTSTNDPPKAESTYELLIYLCKHCLEFRKWKLLLTLSRCLVRMRSTMEGYFYFTTPKEMDGLSTAVGRNKNAPSYIAYPDHRWVYPEQLDYLPEEYFNQPNKYLNTQTNIDINEWFQIVLDIMQNFIGWEVYTFIWAHFCPQLSNLKLFLKSESQILKLRSIVCDQLTLNFPQGIEIPSRTTKPDLQVMFVRTLSGLMGYHTLFSKHDEDLIINALIFGLVSWEKTAIPCIHILTVCCYETPLSIKKFLSLILTKLQTRTSSSLAASPTLEFLLSLTHLETLTSNFTLDEFRRVFAIAFKFIQYYKDKSSGTDNEVENEIYQVHGVDAEVDDTPSTSTQSSTLLNQYVLSLSYQVISNWYIKLDIKERKQLSSYLIRNLLVSGMKTKENSETMAYIDLITRFTYSDMDLDINHKKNSDDIDKTNNNSTSNSWIIGGTILTIETNGVTGESEICIRRPTGTTNMKVAISSPDFPSANQSLLMFPSHILLQLFNNLNTTNNNNVKPIPLIDDPTTNRALSTFDRIPTLTFHKIGLIYIGPNQSEEREILSNRVGSPAYQDLLDNIGSLIKLHRCKKVYVGGLDVESNTDGEYAIFWKNKIEQLIFHTTTMMPNNENDKWLDLKKRHIGNNYVNVFFDELGLPFNFNVIKSQFNFLTIVIKPHSLNTSNFPITDVNNMGGNYKYPQTTYFKVKTFRRAGVPGVFATCHFKIISQEQLPIFIRNLSMIANQFASVWHTPGEYVSNWSHRYNQIQVLRKKTIKSHESLLQEQDRQQKENNTTGGGTNGNNGSAMVNANTAQSFLEQLRDVHPVSNISTTDAIKFEYLGPGESELYSTFEFNSFT